MELMLGNQAVARGAYEAGVKVGTAYPGTPSTEITEYLAKYGEVYCEWSPNEKVALEVAAGASVAGVRALCSMKHVGLNVAADPLFTLPYTGVNGGLVIAVADDPGIHSSQNEQDTRNYAVAAKVPMLEPADSGECVAYARLAFGLSERFDTPVILRLTTRVSHSRGIVADLRGREEHVRQYVRDPAKYVMMPAMARKRQASIERRMGLLSEYASDGESPNEVIWGGKEVGVIAAGIAYQYAAEAMGDSVSYLKLGMVYPLPERTVREFASKVRRLVVVEELDPFIERQVRAMGVDCVGKGLFSPFGEYSVGMVAKALGGMLGEGPATAPEPGLKNLQAPPPPARPPVMCPGCPHRGVFYVLRKLRVTVAGDIGCYTLGALSPLESMDTCLCMGAGVSMAHGMALAGGMGGRSVAVIGDSTFMHSGITSLIDIVYNKGRSTVIILDNSTTAMTGLQQNPATGLTLRGAETHRADLAKLCEAVGVGSVAEVDPFDLAAMEKAVIEETGKDCCSVIIARRPCASLGQSPKGKPASVDRDACSGCGACMRLGCPSLSKGDGKPAVDRSYCVGCGLCAKVCPKGAIKA